MALYRRNQIEQANLLFARAGLLDTTNTDAFLYTAESQRRLGHLALARALARVALKRLSCSSFAHTILAQAYDPQITIGAGTSSDSTWTHALAAVACDSSDGNAWLVIHNQALQRGDSIQEERALLRMVSSGFLSQAAVAYARWVLEGLPARAILMTGGDLDFYPARAVQAQGVRRDVAVVGIPTLAASWYARIVRDRYGVSLYLSDAEVDSVYWRGSPLADSIVTLWRAASQRGDLGRPLTFAETAGVEAVEKGGGARYRLAGPYLTIAPDGDTLPCDTAAMRIALHTAPARSLNGPVTGVGDRSPVRLSEDEMRLRGNVLYLWGAYIEALFGAGRAAEAREASADLETFVQQSGADGPYLEQIRKVIRSHPDRAP